MMNSKERIEAVFQKKHPDKIPVNHRGFTSKIASYILGREAFVGGGIQKWREAKSLFEGWHDEFLERSFNDAVEISLKTEQDLLRPEYWRQPQKPTKRINEYTYLYEYGDEKLWKVLEYNPISEQARYSSIHETAVTMDDIREQVKSQEKVLELFEPNEESYKAYIKAQKMYGHEMFIETHGASLSIPITADSIWFEALIEDPGLVKAKLAVDVEKAKKVIPFLVKYGFKIFLGGNDFASQIGPMYSPKLFDEIFLPKLHEISDICHKNGVYHIFASDGNLWPVSDSLFIKSKLDGYYEVDRKAGMDLQKLRNTYPELTLLGNISSWTLSQGTSEDVREEVLSCMEVAKSYSGIIVGVSNYIMPETPLENIDVLLETISLNR